MVKIISHAWTAGVLMLVSRPVDVEVRLSENVAKDFDHVPAIIQNEADKAFGSENELTSKVTIVLDVRYGQDSPLEADMTMPGYPDMGPVHIACDGQCNVRKFVNVVIAQMDAVLQEIDKNERQQLESAKEETQAETSGLEMREPDDVGENTSPSMLDKPQTPVPGRPLVASGAAALAVGVAGIVTGGVLLGRARRDEEQRGIVEDGELSLTENSWLSEHQSVPLGVLIGGVAASGVGVALITVGTKRMNRHKQTLSILPTPGSIVLSGRF